MRTLTLLLSVAAAGEKEAERSFTLDAIKMSWVTSDPLCTQLPAATYRADVTNREGKPSSLRLELLGTDACAMRVDDLKGAAGYLRARDRSASEWRAWPGCPPEGFAL